MYAFSSLLAATAACWTTFDATVTPYADDSPLVSVVLYAGDGLCRGVEVDTRLHPLLQARAVQTAILTLAFAGYPVA